MCHAANGMAPEMRIGGSVLDNNTSVQAVEVRVVDKNGAEVAHTYSDADGNFYLNATALARVPNGPFSVGVRTASGAVGMMGTITHGGCNAANTCHGGTEPPVHVP
jgi:hypothetical protein